MEPCSDLKPSKLLAEVLHWIRTQQRQAVVFQHHLAPRHFLRVG